VNPFFRGVLWGLVLSVPFWLCVIVLLAAV